MRYLLARGVASVALAGRRTAKHIQLRRLAFDRHYLSVLG